MGVGVFSSRRRHTRLVSDWSSDVWLFFFQAEDGIRDWSVTGVQTCGSSDLRRSRRLAASVSVSGLPVWMNPTQQVVVSVSALAASVVLGTIIAVSGVTAVSNLSTVVTVLNLPYVTTALPTGASTGLIVVAKDFARQPVVIFVTSTVIGSSTTVLMTVYTNYTTATAGASFWVPPANKTFRIKAMGVNAQLSAVASAPVFIVLQRLTTEHSRPLL